MSCSFEFDDTENIYRYAEICTDMHRQSTFPCVFCIVWFLCAGICAAYSSGPSSTRTSLIVVFGRPGSGKTTIAETALEKLLEQRRSNGASNFRCFGLDLDVCIPQWMKDNFAKGIYPTLQQRQDVAKEFCDYVDDRCHEEEKQSTKEEALGALVSFSFVNTDLRDIFRERFPTAVWILVDTSEKEASLRISQREGHFYGGKPTDGEKADAEEAVSPDQNEVDNSEWNFAPVDFPHTILDGNQPIDSNAMVVSNIAWGLGKMD